MAHRWTSYNPKKGRYKDAPALISLNYAQLVMWNSVVQAAATAPGATVDIELEGNLEESTFRKIMWGRLKNPHPTGRKR